MNYIVDTIEEHIFDYIIHHLGMEKIQHPNDIMHIMEEDELEDLKDRAWDLIRYEINLISIFEKVEQEKQKEKELYGDDEDEEMKDADSSTDEDDE